MAQSALHGYSIHPTLGARPNDTRKGRDEGTVLQTLMLRKGAEPSVYERRPALLVRARDYL